MKFEIDRRSGLSYEEFASEYLYRNKPVVVTDAISCWKALSRWTPEFFKREYGEMKFDIDESLSGPAAYDAKTSTVEYTMSRFIDKVLDSSEETPAPYFRNRVLYEMFPGLKSDIDPLPEYLLPNWLPDRYLVSYVGKVLNRGAALELYIGGQGGMFPVLHYDGAGTHAFLMQIFGRKQFIVYPPEQEPFLYPSPEKENLSLVNSVQNPDLKRFPLFAKAQATTFILEPGEMVFVPSHWWHTTRMLTPCITVSANVLNQSNWHELVKFVVMRRRNPIVAAASRAYLAGAGSWRFLRDRHWRKRAGSKAK